MESKSFNFCIVNTLRVEYSSINRPTNKEIIIFLKELDINWNNLFGFYGSETENMFLVKFNDGKDLKFCSKVIENKKFIMIKEEECEVSATIVSSFETELFLHSLPFEIPDEEVINKVSKYGKIKKIEWQKAEISEDLSVFNGIRICTIEINKVIPPYIYIRNVKIRAYYKHQKDMCYKCMSIAHHRSECTKTDTQKNVINNIEVKKEQQSEIKKDKHNENFDVQDSTKQWHSTSSADDNSEFQIVGKKTKKAKCKKSSEVEEKQELNIPGYLQPKKHDNIILNHSTFETEVSYILTPTKYSYHGCHYPTNGTVHARYLSKQLLFKAKTKTSDTSNKIIQSILEESKRLGIKLIWFLHGTRIYYFVDN